jgi:glycosyltransferase involved in cell wall biosynthesis
MVSQMENAVLPKVALITIYYNRAENVTESIKSLIDQTYPNLEVIVVDDCSPDDTYIKLQEACKDDPRIKLSRNPINKGFTNTIIDTIDSLDVPYIAIHGSGDISLPTRIEEQVLYLEKNQEVGVLTTDLVNRKASAKNPKEITFEDLYKKNRITHGAVMFRLADYRKAGGYRRFFTMRQDKDLWFRMSLITKIHFYPKKLYKLVKIKNSVSGNAHKTALPTLLSGFAKFLIQERLSSGTDSLDLYGEKGALYYNPTFCNKQLRKNISINLLTRNFKGAASYIDVYLKINRSLLKRGGWQILNLFLKKTFKIK